MLFGSFKSKRPRDVLCLCVTPFASRLTPASDECRIMNTFAHHHLESSCEVLPQKPGCRGGLKLVVGTSSRSICSLKCSTIEVDIVNWRHPRFQLGARPSLHRAAPSPLSSMPDMGVDVSSETLSRHHVHKSYPIQLGQFRGMIWNDDTVTRVCGRDISFWCKYFALVWALPQYSHCDPRFIVEHSLGKKHHGLQGMLARGRQLAKRPV